MLFSRTNYFQVRDSLAFKAWASRLCSVEVRQDTMGRFSILSTDDETGMMPDMKRSAEPGDKNEWVCCSFLDELVPHLHPQAVALVFSVGENPDFPDHPYGQVTALHSQSRLWLNLQDIGTMCAQHFGIDPMGLPVDEWKSAKKVLAIEQA